MLEEIKREVSEILEVKPDKIKKIKRFKHGMSNFTYKVIVDDKIYVYRKAGEGAELFTNFSDELNNISLAINNNLTSELIYFDVESGTKLSRYIEGNEIDLSGSLQAESFFKTLKKMHSITNQNIKEYSLSERLNKYESYLDKTLIDDNYYLIKDYILNTYNKHFKDLPKVFCHNDLQEANIIYNIESMETHLIDFEYGGLNDLYYDLASIEYEPCYVYKMYFGKDIDRDSENHINFYKTYQFIQWYLLATYKEDKGFSKQTNYDFKKLADYYITSAYNLYETIKGELK